MLKRIIKNNKYLFYIALLIKEIRIKNRKKYLREDDQKILHCLEKDGIAVIKNFFTDKECRDMVDIFEGLDGRYAKYYSNDKRIFGIEKLSEVHNNLFHKNKMFKNVGEAYIGEELVLQTTMAAKITSDVTMLENGSGGGWHRDSFSKQFKAIAYLEDVDIENGPFMYIKGSHKMSSIKKVLFALKEHIPVSSFRYTKKEFEKIKDILNKDISYFTATKGTLILADIRGLHTGMPIIKGHRYSVFNYYIAKSFHQPHNNIELLAEENYK